MEKESLSETLIRLTTELNQAILDHDLARYKELTSPEISSFEPEGDGHLLLGLVFHEFYFTPWNEEKQDLKPTKKINILSPHVQVLPGEKAAVVSYVKVTQHYDKEKNSFRSESMEETRVWALEEKGWRQVHFHRSPCKRS